MPYEGKKSADKWFPVTLIDDDDFLTGKTAVAFGDVTCKYSYEGATGLSAYAVTAAEWKETGEGKYWLLIGASEFASEGKYEVSITVSDCVTYNFCVEVRDNTIAEMMDNIDTLLTRLPAALSFTGANVNANAQVTAAPADMALNSTVAKEATVAALNNISAAQVNAEVVDVIRTDTNAELAALPGASPTFLQMVQFVYEALRNKITQTTTTKTLFRNDGTTTLGTATVSDDNTTFTRARVG